MYQAIPAQNDIRVRQRIARDVGHEKPGNQFAAGHALGVGLDVQPDYTTKASCPKLSSEPAHLVGPVHTPMHPTTARQKARIVAGAVAAVIMSAVLFVVALAFLL